MHKGVILLLTANSREDAIEKANEFLQPYGNDKVWDWYAIGNRWHNLLAPKEKVDSFNKKAVALYPQLAESYSISEIENPTVRPVLQKLWQDEGLTGTNPYWSSYGHEVEDTENDYNVVPLIDCIEIVREWKRDVKKEKAEIWQRMLAAKDEATDELTDMSAYYAQQYHDVSYGKFSFECGIYNVEEGVAENIPTNLKGFWAVIVDMHS